MTEYNYKNVASEYDDLLKQYKWQAPELLLDYLSKHIRKGTKLLDIGVGTGISSQRFHPLQVELYGLDNSPDMLAICEAKQLFKEVRLFDILNEDIPYPETTFDYVICSGVLHFFPELDSIFAKISRVVKNNGLFAFTVIENHKDEKPYYTEISDGVNIYHHSMDYIETLSQQQYFTRLHEQIFTTIKDLDTGEMMDNTLMVFRKE